MRIIIIGIMPFHDYDYTKSYSGQSNSLIVMISNSGASGYFRPDGWRSHLSWPSWDMGGTVSTPDTTWWFLPMVGVVR